jgi:hypothetical protein
MHLRDNDQEDTTNIIKMKEYVVFRKHLVRLEILILDSVLALNC